MHVAAHTPGTVVVVVAESCLLIELTIETNMATTEMPQKHVAFSEQGLMSI